MVKIITGIIMVIGFIYLGSYLYSLDSDTWYHLPNFMLCWLGVGAGMVMFALGIHDLKD